MQPCQVARRLREVAAGVAPDLAAPSVYAPQPKPVRAIKTGRPEVPNGLVLPDDVLMLAQAQAGNEDLVEWISNVIRAAVTPKAVTLVTESGGALPQGDRAGNARSRSAEKQAAYRARQRARAATIKG
jgi:hypothetical protein